MDSFKALPPPGYRFKVYIIDEVHMLSISAFNALLKSLEEPPPNTVFILATTEVHKIPETVISRCQRHDFRALGVHVIEARLAEVCAKENLKVEPEALTLVARLADGSMRDAQTLLDRVQTFCAGAITAAETSQALGTVERSVLGILTQHIVKRDVASVLSAVADLFATGIDPATLLKEFTSFWREVFVAKLGGEARLRTLGLGDDSVVELLRLVAPLETVDVQDLWDLAREGADRCSRTTHPRYGFEALVVRMATRQPVRELGELIGEALSNTPTAVAKVSRQSSGPEPVTRPQVNSVDSAGKGSPVIQQGATKGAQPSAATPNASSSAGSLDWHRFLAFVGEQGARIMHENLKRLRPTRFDAGVLEGTGPEFTVNSVMRDKSKLYELLGSFIVDSKTAWKVTLQKGAGAVDTVAPQKAEALNREAVESHPALQSLQKIFPGSKVEQVRVKGS